MAELPAVVTLTTISSDWGNKVASRTVQRYSSVANRTTEHPTPTEGDLSYLEDSNTVWVYNGTAWVAVVDLFGPPVLAGADADDTASALTTTPTDKASVVFTKPAGWTTYALVAWGAALGSAGSGLPNARIEIGASNGTTVNGVSNGEFQTLAAAHTVTAQTATPVTVAIAVFEAGGDAFYDSSTIQYVAYRLT